MKLPELHQWVVAFGWTLVHSLWQAGIIIIGSRILSSLFPRSAASAKYVISASALMLMLISAMTTFVIMMPATESVETSVTTLSLNTIAERSLSSPTFFDAATLWIEQNLDLFLLSWFAGVIVFSLRLTTAWWHSTKLRKSAVVISGYWRENLERMAVDLRVSGKIILAQCDEVTTPVVLGVVKPMILLPVGMLTGLSTDQVEAILLHELAHIRRHDYLVNIFQSVMEIIFFFNPFVWMVSSRMRTEREQCCDDIVVAYKNPMSYARALHHLEEARVLHGSIGVAAAGHKNQLLQRIQRIMEPTQPQQRGRKVVPSFVIIALLIAASWISVHATRNPVPIEELFTDNIPADTVIKGKAESKNYSYSRKSVTTYDGKGNPHEEVVEKSTGDPIEFETVPDFVKEMRELDVARFPNGLTSLPGEVVEVIPPVEFDFADTLLPRQHIEWNEFNKQFNEEFKTRFGDFYKKNGPELRKMMEEVEVKMQEMQKTFAVQDMVREKMMNAMTEHLKLSLMTQQEAMDQRRIVEDERRRAHDEERDMDIQKLKSLNNLQEQAVQKEVLELQQLKLNEMILDQQHQLELLPRDITDTKNPFNHALKEQLVKDHYLSDTENVESLNWDGDNITINNKKIKAKDAAKYNKMLKEYWDRKPSKVGKPE